MESVALLLMRLKIDSCYKKHQLSQSRQVKFVIVCTTEHMVVIDIVLVLTEVFRRLVVGGSGFRFEETLV